jgi:hypothetical protein
LSGARPAHGAVLEWIDAWPGWSPTGTLVLAVDPARWAPPAAPFVIDDVVFAAKHELHVTVVGRALGAEVLAAIAEGRIATGALRDAFAAQRWRLRRSGRRLRLRKLPPAGGAGTVIESVIEPVALPAMARFHAWLGNALGRDLPVPPPHVTLYVRGDPEGIGVPDEASLARYRCGDEASLTRRRERTSR